MKKTLTALIIAALMLSAITGCSGGADGFNEKQSISVVSREDGSGTRGAFIELFGIQVKGDDGTDRDMTTKEAIIADGTNVMMTNIAGDPYAIGYISLGSLNGTVKALNIDGVQASVENIKNGTYTIQRPFNIAWAGEAEGLHREALIATGVVLFVFILVINALFSLLSKSILSGTRPIPKRSSKSYMSVVSTAGRSWRYRRWRLSRSISVKRMGG